jgi:hypothetical protein
MVIKMKMKMKKKVVSRKKKIKDDVLKIKEVQDYIKRDNVYRCFKCKQPIFINDQLELELDKQYDVTFQRCDNCDLEWFGIFICNVFSSPNMFEQPEPVTNVDEEIFEGKILA